ncbi:MAG TPA: DNA polymerase III subunit gamma/tau [Eubacterium sp.]|nr:DNA polymerase III subunit gamma/tau [Eubacterium sp.]
MSYTALYRKWRPSTFDEVKGQDHIVTTLKNQVINDRIGHAYLFCGTRGTGKTSVAKILAKAVNCAHPVDGNPCGECEVCRAVAAGASMNVIEIDAASNNGVDNIREIKEEVAYPPTQGRFKVYIIDEVHMLSIGAFNALLKTLEEPPAYVIFILATTEAHKIPITILSRCQRYDFKRISIDTISARLSELMVAEDISADERALRYVAKAADGSMRDALSLLDQCLAFYMGQELKYENVLEVLGAVDTEVFSDFFRGIVAGDAIGLIHKLEKIIIDGRDLSQFVSDFTWYLRNLMLLQSQTDASDVLEMSEENMKLLKEDAKLTDLNGVMRYIRIFSELSGQLKNSSQKRVMVEVALIKMTQPAMEKGLNDALMDRIAVLERRMDTGLEAAARAMAAGGFAAGAGALTGDNGGMTADAAAGGTQAGMGNKPKPARSEDITEVIRNWRSICNGLSMSLKPILEHYTTKANGGGNKLQLIYEDATYYSMVSRQEVIDMIKQAIAAKTGLDMEIEVIHAESGTDVSQEYDTLEDICRMNIVEEDF